MDENMIEMSQEQMENVKGGEYTAPSIDKPVPMHLTGSPHCKACRGDMSPYGAYFRCTTAGCKEQGKNKNPGEVDWY